MKRLSEEPLGEHFGELYRAGQIGFMPSLFAGAQHHIRCGKRGLGGRFTFSLRAFANGSGFLFRIVNDRLRTLMGLKFHVGNSAPRGHHRNRGAHLGNLAQGDARRSLRILDDAPVREAHRSLARVRSRRTGFKAWAISFARVPLSG